MKPKAFDPQIILQDERVLLRPLQEADFDALFAVASDPDIWAQHPAKERSTREGFQAFFQQALENKAAFVSIDKTNQIIIGSTRYHPCPDSEDAIEIGWTFLARKYWGGTWNATIKHLMIAYAHSHFNWVLFHIHKDNLRSRKAVEKIGAEKIESMDKIPVTLRSPGNVVYGIKKKS